MRPSLHTQSKPLTTFHCGLTCVMVAFLLIQILVVAPCLGAAFRLPINRLKVPVHLKTEKVVGQNRPDQRLISQRDLYSSEDHGQFKANMTGLSGDGYYVDMFIGTPPQKVQILVDTGSANFAVASEPNPDVTHYFSRDNSSSFYKDGRGIYVPYTEGEWTGTLGTDLTSFSLLSNVSARVNIACITESKEFFTENAKWQGILGLAYSELSRPDRSIEPFWDSIVLQNPGLDNVFSMLLCGSSFVHTQDKPLMEGTLLVGGVDPSLTKGPILYTPIYKEWYYEVIITDMAVAGQSLGLPCKEYNFDKTIVDSGTTTIHLPYTVFNTLVDRLTETLIAADMEGYATDAFFNGDQVICFSDMTFVFSVFPSVSFHLQQNHNSSFRLDISAQNYLRPVEGLTSMDASGSQGSETCVKFGFTRSTTGTVLGAVFMEAFYVVFDRNSSRVGFGQTTCPLPDPSNPTSSPSVSGPIYTDRDLSICAYKKPSSQQPLLLVSYVLAGLAVVVVLPLFLMCLVWGKRMVGGGSRGEGENTSDSYTQLTDTQ